MMTGIELMLKRMETHPEEFVGVSGGCSKEWYAVFSPVIPYLTEEELNAVNEALKKAHREHFTGQVMKQMAGESVISDRDKHYADEFYGRSLADMLNKTNESRAIASPALALKGAYPIKAYPQLISGSSS
jgi:hypothetical protein